MAANITKNSDANKLFLDIVDYLQCAIYQGAFDIKRPMNFITSACKQITGYSPEEFIKGRVFYGDLIVVEDRFRVWNTIKQASQSGNSFNLNYRIRDRNGNVKWIWEKGYRTSQNGGIEQTEGMFMESLDYINMLNLLQQREELFRALAEFSKDIVFRVRIKPTVEYEYISPSIRQIMGYDPEELYENPELTTKIVHKDSKKCCKKIKSGHIPEKPFVLKVKAKDGRIVYIEQNIRAIRNENNEIIALQGVARDITERIMLEQELHNLNKELEKKVKERTEQLIIAKKMSVIGELTSGIVHDFNNILTAIEGSVTVIKDNHKSNAVHKMLKIIEKQIEFGRGLIERLLAYAAAKPFCPKMVTITEFFNEVIPLLKPLVHDKAFIKIEGLLEGKIWIDPLMFKQIIINIIKNAKEAIENRGTITIKTNIVPHTEVKDFEINYIQPGTYVSIAISDNGKGIKQKDIKKIFMPFYSSKNHCRGLGLAQVYGLTRKYGGYIDVQSRVNEGTTFTLYFPAK
ncbi:MAG: PAS domain-containing protein [Candidatus Heimdallarchaeaceae archaeon]